MGNSAWIISGVSMTSIPWSQRSLERKKMLNGNSFFLSQYKNRMNYQSMLGAVSFLAFSRVSSGHFCLVHVQRSVEGRQTASTPNDAGGDIYKELFLKRRGVTGFRLLSSASRIFVP